MSLVRQECFGLSWQIAPRVLIEAINSSDTASAKRVMQAMMQMVKIDIAKIEAAFRGEPRLRRAARRG